MNLKILFEDTHVIVCYKPAGGADADKQNWISGYGEYSEKLFVQKPKRKERTLCGGDSSAGSTGRGYTCIWKDTICSQRTKRADAGGRIWKVLPSGCVWKV